MLCIFLIRGWVMIILELGYFYFSVLFMEALKFSQVVIEGAFS